MSAPIAVGAGWWGDSTFQIININSFRPPHLQDVASARFISMSLKTSEYSLGVRCAVAGLLQRFDRAADPEAERFGPGEEPIDFANTSLIECLHSLRLSVRSPRWNEPCLVEMATAARPFGI